MDYSEQVAMIILNRDINAGAGRVHFMLEAIAAQ
jgi:hypothetical protein